MGKGTAADSCDAIFNTFFQVIRSDVANADDQHDSENK